MQNNELLKAYHQGERNFGGLKLQGINLGGADLIEIIFSESNLYGANFLFAYLNRANLSQSNLAGANLSGASLNQADLSGADLYWTRSQVANFKNKR